MKILRKHNKRAKKYGKLVAQSLLGIPKEKRKFSKVLKKKLPKPVYLVLQKVGSIIWLILRRFWRITKAIAKGLYYVTTHPVLRYAALAGVVVILFALIGLLKDLPSPRNLTQSENFAVSTQIFDRNGELLYEIFADENRIPIELDSLPPYVYQATIAIEDKNFYSHFGFDLMGILRAAINNLTSERLEGGSTITQQLVKNALLSHERSIQRKIKEGVLSIFTELLYSKEEILEMYMNYISYGGTAVGIEAAAQTYFDKSASELSLAEASLLAGLPQAPTYYSPFGSNAERAKERQREVLRRMHEDGYISQAEVDQAFEAPLTYAISKTDIQAPHFVFYVRDLLYEEYGVETVERGGLRVTTTLDLNLQKAAEASVAAEIDTLTRHNVSNGAALILKPNTGEILAMVGSKNYFDAEGDGKVNVTVARRQPGSSIKPIMYATAFQQKKLNPGSVLIDMPTCFTSPGQQPYCPKNYDGSFKGPVTIRRSLGNSLNIPAVKSLRIIGVETFMKQATDMGITDWDDPKNYGLSLTLGGGEVRMIDLAQAFAVLANQGVKTPVTPFLKIEDYTGKVHKEIDTAERIEDLEYLTQFAATTAGDLTRVMDREPAYMTAHIMQDNTARVEAFGSRSELVIPNQIVSVKTGTTNDLRDNWTVGFTPEFLVITWVGNNDSTPMNRNIVSGVTGAAPIFNDLMSYILQGKESKWQEKPSQVLEGAVCPSGMPPREGESCSTTTTDLYWESSNPTDSEIVKKEFWIDPTTGLPPPYGEEVEGLVLEEHTFYSDPLTDMYCLDCTRPITEDGKPIYERFTVPYDYQKRNSLTE